MFGRGFVTYFPEQVYTLQNITIKKMFSEIKRTPTIKTSSTKLYPKWYYNIGSIGKPHINYIAHIK